AKEFGKTVGAIQGADIATADRIDRAGAIAIARGEEVILIAHGIERAAQFRAQRPHDSAVAPRHDDGIAGAEPWRNRHEFTGAQIDVTLNLARGEAFEL